MKKYLSLIFLFFISCYSLDKKEINKYEFDNGYIVFSDNKIYGNSGVNNFSASIDYEKEFKISSIASTKMAASKEEMQKEYNFFNALKNVISIDVKKDKLIMITKDNKILTFYKSNDFMNKKFKLVSKKFKKLNISLNFTKDKIYGFSGINQYFANYTIVDSKIKISNLAITLMAGSLEKSKLELEFLNLLENNKKIYFEDNNLILLAENGEKLVFVIEK